MQAKIMEKLDFSYIAGRNVKWYNHLGIISEFLIKLNACVNHKTYPLHSWVNPREMKIYVHIKTCPQMFIALFLIAKNRKQPNVLQWVTG